MTIVHVTLLVFVFGLTIGSFLNVVILRFDTGKNFTGRSQCLSCRKTLSWYELIPLLSYIFFRAKCSSCGSRISVQYPLVEALTGLIFVVLYFKSDFNAFNLYTIGLLVIDYLFFSLLIVISVYDIRHFIIPDTLSLLVFLSALLKIIVARMADYPYHSLLSATLGAFLLALFFWSLWKISKGAWMGLGDAKLSFGLGFYLGLAGAVSAAAFAFWIGASVALISMFFSWRLRRGGEKLTMKSELPFAPFLVMGTFVAFWLGSDIFFLTELFK